MVGDGCVVEFFVDVFYIFFGNIVIFGTGGDTMKM